MGKEGQIKIIKRYAEQKILVESREIFVIHQMHSTAREFSKNDSSNLSKENCYIQ